MKEQIKELRIQIDGLSQLVKELKQLHTGDKFIAGVDNLVYRHKNITEYYQSNESKKTYNSLILAKAWLGKLLGELEEQVYVVDLALMKENESQEDFIIRAKNENLGKYEYKKFETPYQNDGKRKNVEDIEPIADVAYRGFEQVDSNKLFYSYCMRDNSADWNKLSYIEKIDWLRQEIENVIRIIKVLDFNVSREAAIARTNTYNHLCEARFWLGYELSRIRNEKTKR